MPSRAIRPYAIDQESKRAQFESARSSDPIRKLYKTPAWKKTRLQILFRDPICKTCNLAPSTIADHIISARKYIADHGGDFRFFFDEENLGGKCKRCHDSKTAVEVGFAGGERN